MPKIAEEWLGENSEGHIVTFWRYVGFNPNWTRGKIFAWSIRMRPSGDWIQVTRKDYEEQEKKNG